MAKSREEAFARSIEAAAEESAIRPPPLLACQEIFEVNGSDNHLLRITS